jgi:ATP-dependent protease ClpP protease subunit
MIRILGTIDNDAFRAFSEAFDEYKIGAPVTIELNSHGGDAISALAIASKIRLHEGKVTIIVYGECCSAAVIILAYGHRRKMAEEAWVMVHEDTTKLKGEIHTLELELSHARRLEQQWCTLLAGSTFTSAAAWSVLHKKTTYLTANECKSHGLIDEVI